MAYDWVKLWIEVLDDRKTASLPDSLWRRFIECILLAAEINDGGRLPAVNDMAWRLRLDTDTMSSDLSRLALSGLVELIDADTWKVTNFTKRQSFIPVKDRVASHRARQKKTADSNAGETPPKRDSNEHVTNRYTDKIRIDKKRGEENARAESLGELETAPLVSPPPPKVISQPVDRTPKGFAGYTPPPEPPTAPPAQRPEEERQAIGALINALVAVTGKAAKLNPDVIAFAEELYPLGYTAPQVLRAYSNQPTTGWNWYAKNWKGRDKGDRPTIKDIRDTIGGAIDDSPKPAKRLSQIDIALGLTAGG